MICTVICGNDERGWTYLAFEKKDSSLESFLKDTEGVADSVRIKTGDKTWEKPETIHLFVETMKKGGYEIVESVAMISMRAGHIVGLSCVPHQPSRFCFADGPNG